MKSVNFVYDICFISLMLLLLLFAGYARWDSQQFYTAADPVQYLQYKPSPPEMVSFEELQAMNPDVLGWLTIYDTNIDYPLVIGEDNEKYLNRSPKLQPEGSGAIFLDYRNDRHFSDFNTIIFGHHMEHHEMFGDLDLFLEEDFWDAHEYGNLIYDDANHGLQFVAILECDAYDFFLYRPAVKSNTLREKYIDTIYEKALYVRGVDTERLREMQERGIDRSRTSPVTSDDRILLMSTCSSSTTNGRYVLVAKILDHPVENPFPDITEHRVTSGIDTVKLAARIGRWPARTWIILISIVIILLLILYRLSIYLYQKKFKGENANEQNHPSNERTDGTAPVTGDHSGHRSEPVRLRRGRKG